jgi:hypothetical protein
VKKGAKEMAKVTKLVCDVCKEAVPGDRVWEVFKDGYFMLDIRIEHVNDASDDPKVVQACGENCLMVAISEQVQKIQETVKQGKREENV